MSVFDVNKTLLDSQPLDDACATMFESARCLSTCRLNVTAEGQIRSMKEKLQSIESSITEPERKPIPGFDPSEINEDAEPDDDNAVGDEDDESDGDEDE